MAQHHQYGKTRQTVHPAKRPPHSHTWPVPVYDMVLVMGGWKKAYSELALQTLLANALNECSKHPYFTVVAYLITGKRLGLVLEKKPGKKMVGLLRLLYQEVAKQTNLAHWLHDGINTRQVALQHEQGRTMQPLFKVFAQHNTYMNRLMTARPVNPLYYDPHVAKLAAMVKGHRFCSAIDYSGGIGPVVIKLLPFPHA